ncbi:MAG: hypothetical protein V4660_01040 [Pseudomonadota bacterium]
MDYIFAGLNIFFSPIAFLLFFIITPINHIVFSEDSDVNVVRLAPQRYFIFCTALLIMAVLLVASYNVIAPQKIFLIDILQPRYYWLSVGCWIITAITLKSYIRGIEDNIMGFVFFPLLFISSLALVLINLPSLVSGFNMNGKPLLINAWAAFLVHGCNPLLVLLFHTNRESEKYSGEPLILIRKYTAILFFYAFIVALHWLVLSFFGKTLEVSAFFGVGQSLVYFLPFLGGAILHFYFAFSLGEKLPDGQLKIIIDIFLSITTAICIALQSINYLQYWQRVW